MVKGDLLSSATEKREGGGGKNKGGEVANRVVQSVGRVSQQGKPTKLGITEARASE